MYAYVLKGCRAALKKGKYNYSSAVEAGVKGVAIMVDHIFNKHEGCRDHKVN